MSIVSSAASAAAAPSLPQKTPQYFADEIDAVVSKRLKSILYAKQVISDTDSAFVKDFVVKDLKAMEQVRRDRPKDLDSLMSAPIDNKLSLKNFLGKDADDFRRVTCDAALSLAQVDKCVAELVETLAMTPNNPAAVKTSSDAYITARDNAGSACAAQDKVFDILRPKQEQLAPLMLIPREKILEWQQEEAVRRRGQRFP